MRGLPTGGDDARLFPNLMDVEVTNQDTANLTATGFQIATADAPVNASGGTYIYMAIRRGPMRTPTLVTSVFSPVFASSSGDFTSTSGFPIDLVFYGGGESLWIITSVNKETHIEEKMMRGEIWNLSDYIFENNKKYLKKICRTVLRQEIHYKILTEKYLYDL
jgi:hypothetical protein